MNKKNKEEPKVIMTQYNRLVPKKLLNIYKSKCLISETEEHELLIIFMEYVSSLNDNELLYFIKNLKEKEKLYNRNYKKEFDDF